MGDLRAWAEATAPKLTYEDWREAEQDAESECEECCGRAKFEALALLAYRDEVVSELVRSELDALQSLGSKRTSATWVQPAVERGFAWITGRGGAQACGFTSWGREVFDRARKLRR